MKLSEIKYQDLLRATNEDLNRIVFMDNDSQPKTNYGILLGGISMIPSRCLEAIKLYNEGQIKKIILSGGVPYLSLPFKTPEAKKMYDYLISQGIAPEDLILESKSKTTKENIVFFS